MTSLDAARLDQLRQAHSSTRMVGWDFSVLDGRMTSDAPPWDFEAECLAALRRARSALDLGTGGGERLAGLLTALGEGERPALVAATEGWEPNVPVARERLAPLGVQVHENDPEQGEVLPLADAEALVTYLALVPWDAPDFDVDTHAETLLDLDARRPLRVSQRRYRVVARRSVSAGT